MMKLSPKIYEKSLPESNSESLSLTNRGVNAKFPAPNQLAGLDATPLSMDATSSTETTTQTMAQTLLSRGSLLSPREIREATMWMKRDSLQFEDTCDELMEAYRIHESREAFSILFQLNRERFRRIIQSMVRSRCAPFDVDDALDEVFMAIWRYPHRFRAEKANAFRNWSYGIIKNTVRNLIRSRRAEPVDSEVFAELLSDDGAGEPSGVVISEETSRQLGEAYVIMLLLYRRLYDEILNERERKALKLVEVRGYSYKQAAVALSVTLGNLKMIICRARKKIRAEMLVALPGIARLHAEMEQAA